MTSASPTAPRQEASAAAVERLAGAPPDDHYVLRLFVAGITPHSERAIHTVTTLCDVHLKDRYTLTVVDLYQSPDVARYAHIVCAPTLVRQSPAPVRRFIGDLADSPRVLRALDITP